MFDEDLIKPRTVSKILINLIVNFRQLSDNSTMIKV